MPDRINIPITVTGAEQAKAELRGVAAEVQQTGQAGAGGGGDTAGFRSWRRDQVAAQDLEFRQWRARENIGLFAPGQTAGPAKSAADIGLAGGEAAALAATTQQMALAGAAAETAAGKKQLFTRRARMLAATLLGELSPAMGGMVNLFSQIALGIGEMTMGLIALAGGAALLGGLIAFFKELQAAAQAAREAIERANAARREARQEGAATRETLEREAEAMGLPGAGGAAQRQSAKWQKEMGVPADLAQNAALAQEFAKAKGLPFDLREYLGGVIMGGGKPPELEKYPAAVIAQVQAAGRRPEAAGALAAALSQVADKAKAEAPAPGSELVTSVDTAVAQIAKAHPELVAKEVAKAEELVRKGARLDIPATAAEITSGRWKLKAAIMANLTGRRVEDLPAELGGAATGMDILRVAREMKERAAELGDGNLNLRVPTTQPVIINVINNTTHNTDSQYNLGGGAGENLRSYETRHEGAGVEN